LHISKGLFEEKNGTKWKYFEEKKKLNLSYVDYAFKL
jgi:hypothetical protein